MLMVISKRRKVCIDLVRISPFDSAGRRHTSFTSCDVVPEIIHDIGEIEIRSEDLKVDTYRASGAGGQHVNKTESAIRITHIPSGIIVACQLERSQIQNRERAMTSLRSKLYERKIEEQQKQLDAIRGVQSDIAWGSQIRSYVFHPYSMVKDHRTSTETGNVGAVMDGDIDPFINAYLRKQIGQQLEAITKTVTTIPNKITTRISTKVTIEPQRYNSKTHTGRYGFFEHIRIYEDGLAFYSWSN